jgi:hypothetical protein
MVRSTSFPNHTNKERPLKMRIETNQYDIARLMDRPQAVQIIREAEERIARETGSTVTLIAYCETGGPRKPPAAPTE